MVTATFSRAIFGEFVNFDDGDYTAQNPRIARGWDWENIRWALTHIHASNWHPLTTPSHMLDASLFGPGATGLHAANVLFHGLAAVFLFLALDRLFSAPWRNLFVAALFALHPLRVESVAWVSERKDVLSGLFFALILFAYADYAKKPAAGRFVLVLFLFSLGLMAKPMLVTVPLIFLLLDFWPLNRISPPDPGNGRNLLRKCWPLLAEKIPFLALAGASCLATLLAQDSALQSFGNFALGPRLENALVSIVVYLEQWLWPFRLSVIYPLSLVALTWWRVAIAGILVAMITFAAGVRFRRQPYLIVGWLCYLVMLFPVLGIVQVGNQAHADRYTYLPQIGIAIAVTWLLGDLAKAARLPRSALLAGGAAVLTACAAVTIFQIGVWKNSRSLWDHAIAVTPDNHVAYSNRGLLAVDRGDFNGALDDFQRAISANPSSCEPIANAGLVYLKKGAPALAITYFLRALELKPNLPSLHADLGRAYYALGRNAEACRSFERAVRLEPSNYESTHDLAQSLFLAGRTDEAFRRIRVALELNPGSAASHTLLGSIHLQRRDFPEATVALRTAVTLDPRNLTFRNPLAIALTGAKDFDDAIAQYRAALEIESRSAETRRNLGQTFLADGRPAEPIAELTTALDLDPHCPEAPSLIAAACQQQGKISEAVVRYGLALKENPRSVATLNNLAWILATNREEKHRDASRAKLLAAQANALSGGKNPAILGTFAAALAESGDYSSAVRQVETASAFAATPERRRAFERQKEGYLKGIPWRE